jgi:hypothetical protein
MSEKRLKFADGILAPWLTMGQAFYISGIPIVILSERQSKNEIACENHKGK